MQLLPPLGGNARRPHGPGRRARPLAGIPMLVREALRRRFTALPEPAQGVLRLCAAVSTEVDTGLLPRTAAAEGGPVATALDAAVRAGPLGADPHAPGRLHVGTLLDELPHGERVPLHNRVTPGTRARGHGRTGGAATGRPAHRSRHAEEALPATEVLPRRAGRAAPRARTGRDAATAGRRAHRRLPPGNAATPCPGAAASRPAAP
ncbi:hypothetical protein [Streptomyces sp. NPDC047976]|uniref:hypothetical protein n=1 Tax=Streptomyces sp. NPDC047976 TaxID=3155746 RepID=UPI00343E5640